MTSLDIWMGVFLLATSLFSAGCAIVLLDWVSRGRTSRGIAAVPVAAAHTAFSDPRSDPSLPILPEIDNQDQQQLADLGQVVDLLPLLAWRVNNAGAVTWSNRAYRDLLEKTGEDPTGKPPLFAVNTAGKPNSRFPIKLPGQATPMWFEKYSCPLDAGNSLHFALHADPVVRAEEALRNFVQTLTKTFAHLPIGLAIFDRNRQLALFNPALSDLTTLEPAWLSTRPSLSVFLDQLRERRHIPEPKDYNGWRQRISELERAAEDGTYEEHWPLPTGQTYKVTGRPHPEGAVAFLVEDITATISLQRHFRAELELGAAVLDSMPEALAVFSQDGELVMSNDAFTDLWGVEPREMLACMTLDEAIALWESGTRPTAIWQTMRTRFGQDRPKQAVEGRITRKTGAELQISVRPLARGATLCSFSDLQKAEAKQKICDPA